MGLHELLQAPFMPEDFRGMADQTVLPSCLESTAGTASRRCSSFGRLSEQARPPYVLELWAG